jgi:multidrug efflux pump subunit AcrA (membrane-fusion protein)
MVHVVARVTNRDQTIPLSVGLFVNAEIEGLLVDNIVRLPRPALRDASQVLVVDAEDRLQFRTVDLLRLHQDEVFVRGGLAPGERVCVSPLQTVVEGMPVVPVTDGAPDAAAS